MPEEGPEMNSTEIGTNQNRGIRPDLNSQNQQRLAELRQRAGQPIETGRRVLTPTAEAVVTRPPTEPTGVFPQEVQPTFQPTPENVSQLLGIKPPVVPAQGELKPVRPDEIPPQLLAQFLATIPPEDREEAQRVIQEQHSGQLSVQTSVEEIANGRQKLKVELFDPQDPDSRMNWKGGGEGKAENAFNQEDLAAVKTELLGAPATLEDRRKVVSKWCNIVEEISGSDSGFNDDSNRQGLEQVINRTFFTDFDTKEDLNQYVEARVGLDKAWRNWHLARYGVEKSKAAFYAQGGTFFSKDKREILLREMPGVWAAIEEIRVANAAGVNYFGKGHDTFHKRLVASLIGINHPYQGRDPKSKKDAFEIDPATGLPKVYTPGIVVDRTDAEQAVFIAERIMQVGLEAQEYGETVTPNQGLTEGQGKALGILGKAGAGITQAFTRGQIK